MEQSCPFISVFILVLTFQYGHCESYKEWYAKSVLHCIPGTKFKSYTPNFICICASPGVIEDCHFVATMRDAGAERLMRLSKVIGSSNCPKGSRFKHEDGCNWCQCSPNGETLCTRKRCEGEEDKALTSKLTSPKYTCERDRPYTFFDGCNWCQCTSMSMYAVCTDMPCIKKLKHKKYKALNGIVTAMIDFKVRGPSNCTDGRFKQPDGCNWCICKNGWTLFCTRMACVNKKPLSTMVDHDCKNNPQGMWAHPDECNYCYCMDANTPLCTRNLCNKRYKLGKGKGSKKPPVPDEFEDSCEGRPPGEFWSNDGCNICYCSDEGLLGCTYMYCGGSEISLGKKLSSSLCDNRIGKRFKPDSCNSCYCDRQGVASCSVKLCEGSKKYLKRKVMKGNYAMLKGEAKQKLPNQKMIQSLKEKAQTCKTGEKFKEPGGCNWCTCIDDGVVVCDSEPCPYYN